MKIPEGFCTAVEYANITGSTMSAVMREVYSKRLDYMFLGGQFYVPERRIRINYLEERKERKRLSDEEFRKTPNGIYQAEWRRQKKLQRENQNAKQIPSI